jgi:hypothetical protein
MLPFWLAQKHMKTLGLSDSDWQQFEHLALSATVAASPAGAAFGDQGPSHSLVLDHAAKQHRNSAGNPSPRPTPSSSPNPAGSPTSMGIARTASVSGRPQLASRGVAAAPTRRDVGASSSPEVSAPPSTAERGRNTSTGAPNAGSGEPEVV